MAEPTDTLPVSFTVLGIQRMSAGRVVGLANIETDIGGIVVVLQGVQITRTPDGGLAVRAPQFRDGAGVWRSSVILPDALRNALGAETLAAYQACGGAASA